MANSTWLFNAGKSCCNDLTECLNVCNECSGSSIHIKNGFVTDDLGSHRLGLVATSVFGVWKTSLISDPPNESYYYSFQCRNGAGSQNYSTLAVNFPSQGSTTVVLPPGSMTCDPYVKSFAASPGDAPPGSSWTSPVVTFDFDPDADALCCGPPSTMTLSFVNGQTGGGSFGVPRVLGTKWTNVGDQNSPLWIIFQCFRNYAVLTAYPRNGDPSTACKGGGGESGLTPTTESPFPFFYAYNVDCPLLTSLGYVTLNLTQ